jgi:hypothetical protein
VFYGHAFGERRERWEVPALALAIDAALERCEGRSALQDVQLS